jgi:hypothetical protein
MESTASNVAFTIQWADILSHDHLYVGFDSSQIQNFNVLKKHFGAFLQQ